ncbi:MAG: hypothetical protein IJC51_02660 [Eggerthellaceae bacterium]|nr:hypothetical protein [Eggerthellaceae bacterium]
MKTTVKTAGAVLGAAMMATAGVAGADICRAPSEKQFYEHQTFNLGANIQRPQVA